MGFVSSSWFDRVLPSIRYMLRPYVDRCSKPLPWDPLSSPFNLVGQRSAEVYAQRCTSALSAFYDGLLGSASERAKGRGAALAKSRVGSFSPVL